MADPSDGPAPEMTTPVFHILLSLLDEHRHGYGVIKEVEARTDGDVQLTAGTLYGALKRLRNAGMIEEVEEPPDVEDDDDRRRYYRITERGRRAARAEARRLERLTAMARDKALLPASGPETPGGGGGRG